MTHAAETRNGFWPALVTLAFAWLAVCPGGAQVPEYRFANLSTAQGLPHVYVFGVTQDQDGFMWFATQNGLARYDSVRFRIFHKGDGLPGDSISCVFAARDGRLWVGTWGFGLAYMDPRTFEVKAFPLQDQQKNGTNGPFIQCIAEDQRGTIWVGTRRSGLERIDPRTHEVTHYLLPHPRENVKTRIWDICEVGDGRLWLGSSFGLILFDPATGAYEYIEGAPHGPLSNERVLSLARDAQNTLWIGTVNGLNKRHADGRFEQIFDRSDPSDPALANHYRDLLVDHNGHLWLALYANGLKRYDPYTKVFQHFKSQVRQQWKLSNSQLEALFLDRDGTLWVGGRSAGVDRLDLRAHPFFHIESVAGSANSLSHNNVTSFAIQRHGALWVGTEGGGLNQLDPTRSSFTAYRAKKGVPGALSSDLVSAVHVDHSDRLWVGTQDGVVQLLNQEAGTFQRTIQLNAANNAGGNKIWSILAEPESVWVASNTGLTRLELAGNQAGRVVLHVNEPHFHPVYSVMRDSGRRIWAAAQSGLYRMTGELQARPVVFGEGGRTEMITYNVFEDRAGRIWAATAEGLWRLDATLNRASGVPGLETQSVFGVFDGEAGQLWVNTESYLIRYDPERKQLSRFSEADGLQSSNFNVRAGFAHKGELFLGGTNGFNWFRSHEIQEDRSVPSVRIVSVLTEQGEALPKMGYYPTGSLVELPYQLNSLRIIFTALDFKHQVRCSYRFKLEGWDNEWRYTHQDRETYYNHLAPGSYTFSLQVSNTDGVWQEEGTHLQIVIVPPFYRTVPFYAVMIALPFLGLWWWSARKHRMERHLAQIVAEQTRSLRDANQLLEQQAENLKRTQAQLTESAHRAGMAEVASDVLHNIGNAMTSIQVSTSLLETKVHTLRVDFLQNLCKLLKEQAHRLPDFFLEKRGQMIPSALQMVTDRTNETRNELLAEIKSLNHQIIHINEIVVSQREYTYAGNFFEPVDLKAMIEDVVRFQIAKMEEFHIKIEREFEELPPVQTAKAVLLHILNHLIRNAVESLSLSGRENRILSLRYRNIGLDAVEIQVGDNGVGIDPANLTAIFSQHWQGRRVHRRGHLHYCANAIAGIGGALKAVSDGFGKGATFVLTIPREPLERQHDGPGHSD